MLSKEEHIKLLEQKIAQLEEEYSKLKNQNKENETEKKYQSLFEMSDDAILVIEDNTFVDCNQAVVKMLRCNNKEEVLNTHPSDLSPEKQPDGRLSFEKAQEMMDIALLNGSHHFEWIHTRADGENFPVEVWLSKVNYDGKILINTIWRDLTEKKKAEATILNNIKEKEVLLQEIHHRVKNNLQIINSLLNLQASTIDDNHTKNLLLECKLRIESMSKVHEMLYSSNNFSDINYEDYLNEMLQQIIKNHTNTNSNINYEVSVNHLHLDVNTAIPLGLIINEMVTNSLKYAFKGIKNGHISIFMQKLSNEAIEFKYNDNGVGYSTNITFENAKTLGLQLILALVDQLNGTIIRNRNNKGTSYKVLFEVL